MRTVTIVCKTPEFAQSMSRCMVKLPSAPTATQKETLEETITHVQNRRPDFLIVEWAVGTIQEQTVFLQELRGLAGCKSLPVVVVAPALDPRMLAVCTEYNVTKVLNAATVAQTLGPSVESLLGEMAKPSSLKTHLVKLELAVEKGNFGEVDRLVEDFFHLYPDHPRAQIEYANLCIRRGKWDKARQAAQKAAERNPNNLRVVNLMARLMMHEGRHAEAMSALENAELLSPKNLDRLVLMGDIYRTRGENAQAREKYNEALAIDGGFADAKKGLGVVELSEGDVNAALELFRDAASEEEVGGFFNNFAIAAVRANEFEKATHLYGAANDALETKDLKAKVMFNMGLAYRKWSKPEQAAQCFLRAVEYDPGHEKAQKHFEALKAIVGDVGALRAGTADALGVGTGLRRARGGGGGIEDVDGGEASAVGGSGGLGGGRGSLGSGPASGFPHAGLDLDGFETDIAPEWDAPVVKPNEKVISPFAVEVIAATTKAAIAPASSAAPGTSGSSGTAGTAGIPGTSGTRGQGAGGKPNTQATTTQAPPNPASPSTPNAHGQGSKFLDEEDDF